MVPRSASASICASRRWGTNTVYGKVARKYVENGEGLIELDVWNEKQAGPATAANRITVALPMSK